MFFMTIVDAWLNDQRTIENWSALTSEAKPITNEGVQ
jgi:hypothetical protein